MKVKPGTHFELVTKMILESILRSDIKTIDLKHDVILKGLTTSHQIDLYWSFEIGGIAHHVIVQVKDWDQAVNKGELLKFKAILNDLPNQPRGIFVTRSRYQKGALEVAKGNGIVLYELKPVSKSGKGKNLNGGFVEFHLSMTERNNVRVVPDEVWLASKGATFKEKTVDLRSVIFYDSDHNRVSTLLDVLKLYDPDPKSKLVSEKDIVHTFEMPTFTASGTERPYKVKAVTWTLTPREETNVVPLITTDFVGFILEDLSKQTSTNFDNFGRLKEKGF